MQQYEPSYIRDCHPERSEGSLSVSVLPQNATRGSVTRPLVRRLIVNEIPSKKEKVESNDLLG